MRKLLPGFQHGGLSEGDQDDPGDHLTGIRMTLFAKAQHQSVSHSTCSLHRTRSLFWSWMTLLDRISTTTSSVAGRSTPCPSCRRMRSMSRWTPCHPASEHAYLIRWTPCPSCRWTPCPSWPPMSLIDRISSSVTLLPCCPTGRAVCFFVPLPTASGSWPGMVPALASWRPARQASPNGDSTNTRSVALTPKKEIFHAFSHEWPHHG